MRAALVLALAAAAIAAAGAQTVKNRTVTDQSVFPTERPPMWDFRTMDGVSYSCKKATNQVGWTLTVTHKPIANVTRAMMAWMFKNLATSSAVSPLDGKTYPLFLLYHPRDHVRHTHTKMPVAPAIGANASWVEFPLTNCTRKEGGAAFDWDCPSGAGAPNPGYLRDTPQEQWAWKEQVNGTTKISAMGPTSVYFTTWGCNWQGCAPIIKTRHAWTQRGGTRRDPIRKLYVTSSLQVGIGMVENDRRIVDGWANGLDPETKCHRTARHYVEEIGGVENWLAAAYAAAGGKP